jgi:hypothetical protein
VRTIPIEATESIAPVLFYRREFREGSGASFAAVSAKS